MMFFQPATRGSRKTAVVMLCLTSIYLVFELGFNARLLDVVGGSATHDEVDHIEKYGRIISGVALTLLFWGFQIKKALTSPAATGFLAFKLLTSAAVCITLMFFGQKALIDFLADGSTDDTRSRAAVLVPISHLLTTSEFSLTGMDLPPEAFGSPEGKTFVATFALQALAVPNLYRKIEEKSDEIFRLTIQGARGTPAKAYRDYEKSVEKLKAVYVDDYHAGVQRYQREIDNIPFRQRKAWT